MIANLTRGACALALIGSAALTSPTFALTDAEKGEIEGVVRDYLIRNPEVLLEALDALEEKRGAEQAAEQKQAIAAAGASLFESPEGTVLGDPAGDVTVVEFFDYNCGYCKRALGDMDALLAADPKIRFILKEIPVLGDESLAASRVSLAFRQLAPKRYGEFHRKLLQVRGAANEDTALAVAEEFGLGATELRAAMAGPQIAAALDENNRLAGLLKINGTPSYIIADEVVPGAVGLEGLAAKVANVRRCASATC